MAPTKSTRAIPKQASAIPSDEHVLPMIRKGLPRRTAQNIVDQNMDMAQTRGKRKADNSPVKNEKVKRSALGNLTNNVKMMTMTSTLHPEEDAKQQITLKKKDNQIGQHEQILKVLETVGGNILNRHTQHKITTRASAKSLLIEETNKIMTSAPIKLKKNGPVEPLAPIAPNIPMPIKVQNKPTRRISNEFNKTEESLYMSALEDISSSESVRFSGNFDAAKRRSALMQCKPEENLNGLPKDVEDFDKLNWDDPFAVSHYTMDIFNYLKEREEKFPITDYMVKQVNLSKWMRSLLIDWMVEVQETFELNHETLYLAVKIVDLYLCRVVISKDKLQLLGAAALFIACKYDERTPPLVDDFLYICDGAYKHNELIKMEMNALKTIDYDIGIPLSYRFLRRYARCAKIQMPTLTLARYILESALMDYETITFSDSQMAAATLFMALRMTGEKKAWTSTLEYYSGYKLEEFAEIVVVLNAGLHRKPKATIKTIRSKYSHKIFHEVAKVPLMTTAKLFEDNLDFNSSFNLDNLSSFPDSS
ncbi:G2/mitotic-specific cyclin-B3-like [Teleopsis dalmanni]|uniref:G2/mitotic-specific cyclin-B3-like n=1 Tax=Teleopsis dalmanni TaxID=139649 RepID=UPI0018CD36FF|nr:G2/mitotic-specific cyclin-B3-like [Teleopsis dalmanni]